MGESRVKGQRSEEKKQGRGSARKNWGWEGGGQEGGGRKIVRKEKRKQPKNVFYIMHEQGGRGRRTKQDQINRRSEALMMWHKCNTKPAGKTCSLSFCLLSHRGIMT